VKPLDHALRAYRWICRPLARRLIRGRDRSRLAARLADLPQDSGPPVFVIVVPNTLGWLEPCLKLVPREVAVVLIANGLSRRERRLLAAGFPDRLQFALSAPPGAYAKHGTVLDLLVAAAPGDFVLLDHDCYVFDRSLFAAPEWRDDEFLAAVDAPGFFTINAGTGLRFPRTHFLIVRRDRFRELAERHGVGCEKVERTPERVRGLIAGVGLGDHNFPPARMPFFDTLQLAMAVAFAREWKVRWLGVTDEGIAHIGGTARERNQPVP
jgi:hypothetical protein